MRLNTAAVSAPIQTHEGGSATPTDAFHALKRSVLTCLLHESTFYEEGVSITERIAQLVPQVQPAQVAALACEARDRMYLRHAPLFLATELSKIKGAGTLVADTLEQVIQRPDELGEFLAIYWQPKKHPLSSGVKRGLARAFQKFENEYSLAKWNRDSSIKLKDVMFLVHPKPKDQAQDDVWKRLIKGTLPIPITWETELSAGKDKRATFEMLLREKKMPGMACLMNLRNMLEAKVDEGLIRERLMAGIARAFPYRFVVAAKHAPRIEDAIETAMLKSVEELESLEGKTGLLIDVSGSMDYRLGNQNESSRVLQSGLIAKPDETSRIDVAAGLAILLREKAESVRIATFSGSVVEVPPRRGFALRDAIKNSQPHSSTLLAGALNTLRPHWSGVDRLIVITDEQSQDGIAAPWVPKSYVINVAPYKNGVSYRNGWRHIDGWSERVIDYVREIEQIEAA